MGFFDSIGDALASGAGAIGRGAVTGANQGEQQGYNRQKAQELLAAKQATYHAAAVHDPDAGSKLTAAHVLEALDKWDRENGEVLANDKDLAARHAAAKMHLWGVVSGQIPVAEMDLEYGQPGHRGGPPLAETGPGAAPGPEVTPPNVNQTPSLFEQVGQAPPPLAPVTAPSNLGEVRKQAFGAPPLPFQFGATQPPVPPVLAGEPRGGLPAPPPVPSGPSQPSAPAPSGSPVHDRLAQLMNGPAPVAPWAPGMTAKAHAAEQKRLDAERKNEIASLQKQLTVAPRGAILSAQAPYAAPQAAARLGQTEAATGLAKEQTRASQVVTPVKVATGLSGIQHQREMERQGKVGLGLRADLVQVARQNAGTAAKRATTDERREAATAAYQQGVLKRINFMMNTHAADEAGKDRRAMLAYYGGNIRTSSSVGMSGIKGSQANSEAAKNAIAANKLMDEMQAEQGGGGASGGGSVSYQGPPLTAGEIQHIKAMGANFPAWLSTLPAALRPRALVGYRKAFGKAYSGG